MANVIDGGVIVVGVEDDNCKRQGVTAAQIASYNYDLMRDQIDPYADPRVVFSRQILKDSAGLSYVIIEVAPFEEMPVICARDGHDVDAGAIYFRSRSRRPASARISRVEDMREIIEASISRRFRNLRRAGFVPAAEGRHALDEELGDL